MKKEKKPKKPNKIWKWAKENIFVKDMILWILFAEAIFWTPVIFGFLLAVFVSQWWWVVVSAYILFWAGPFTPAVPLQFGLALLLRRLFKHRKKVIASDSDYSRCSERPYSTISDGDTTE